MKAAPNSMFKLVLKPVLFGLVFGLMSHTLVGAPAPAQSRIEVQAGDYHRTHFALEAEARLKELTAVGYELFDAEDRSKEYRPIEILVVDMNVVSLPMVEFVKTLADEKQTLMNLYGIDNHVYNQLALMAVGILGNETDFFRSPAYTLFSMLPDDLNYQIKRLDNFLFNNGAPTDDLSKGPTRMKSIPEKITEHYRITHKEQLEVPFNAAVATLGYLANTREELFSKIKKHEMTCVTEQNFYDVLLYLYFGGRSYREKLVKCDIEPYRNVYVRNTHKNRKAVLLLEK